MKRILKIFTLLALVLIFLVPGMARATLFSASSGDLAASADFSVDAGGNLVVVLTNAASVDALVPTDVLTAVFWTMPLSVTLTKDSAVLTDGSIVTNSGPSDFGGVVGGEWAYKTGLSGAPHAATSGISSAGFDLFSPSNVFPGSNLQGPADPDGIQYGLVSGIGAGANSALLTNYLIKNSVTFTLSGLPVGFTEADISNVSFQYGTALTEPNIVPIPPSALLLGSGLLGIGLIGSRRRKKAKT